MTKSEVAKEARRIFREMGSHIPVNIEAIAARLNIEVMYPELENDVSGMLVIKGNKTVIGLNATQALTRRRFTTAHEIGHYILHQAAGRVFVDGTVKFRDKKSSTGTSLEEIQANTFAAELLMPADDVRRRAQQMIEEEVNAEDAVWRLADRYQVSEEAMRNRLKDLGYIVD